MVRMQNVGIWVLGRQGKGKLSCLLSDPLGKRIIDAVQLLMEKGTARLVGARGGQAQCSQGCKWKEIRQFGRSPESGSLRTKGKESLGHRPGTGEFSGMLCPVLDSMWVALGLLFPILWLQIEESSLSDPQHPSSCSPLAARINALELTQKLGPVSFLSDVLGISSLSEVGRGQREREKPLWGRMDCESYWKTHLWQCWRPVV